MSSWDTLNTHQGFPSLANQYIDPENYRAFYSNGRYQWFEVDFPRLTQDTKKIRCDSLWVVVRHRNDIYTPSVEVIEEHLDYMTRLSGFNNTLLNPKQCMDLNVAIATGRYAPISEEQYIENLVNWHSFDLSQQMKEEFDGITKSSYPNQSNWRSDWHPYWEKVIAHSHKWGTIFEALKQRIG